MLRIASLNLGCKVNSYELDALMQGLEARGYAQVPFDQAADVYVVNTCTVTHVADQKSRQMLRRAKKANPMALVVALGCFVQAKDWQALEEAGVDLAIGNNRKKDLLPLLEQAWEEKLQGRAGLRLEVKDLDREREYEDLELLGEASHTRAYVKIQDGCNQFCSYCIIPKMRGRVRSRKPGAILEELRRLAAAGCREVVLTGIHISSYGLDISRAAWEASLAGQPAEEAKEAAGAYPGRLRLLDLLEVIHGVEGISRIRLGSLEPRVMTKDHVVRLAALDKFCPHFHLSLQSGCDRTLERMHRRYSAEDYRAGVALARRYFDRPAIATDIIVGFPGESEEDFAQSLAFVEEMGFAKVHVFPFSPREGTLAAAMDGQCPARVKKERSQRMQAAAEAGARAYLAQWLGRRVEILLEEQKTVGGRLRWLGHSREFVALALPLQGDYGRNSLVEARVLDFLEGDVLEAQMDMAGD